MNKEILSSKLDDAKTGLLEAAWATARVRGKLFNKEEDVAAARKTVVLIVTSLEDLTEGFREILRELDQ